MADDSLPVEESMKYHPADSPRGTLFYILEDLTGDQQEKLNALKIDTVRENEKYLAAHPQIRAIIVLLLRVLLRRRPILKVHEFIAKFFNRSESDIAQDVDKYLASRKDHVYESLSAVNFIAEKAASQDLSGISEEHVPEKVSEFVCSEECLCFHNMEWKTKYKPHDYISFSETEHWITPKTTRTSINLEEIQSEASEEFFSFFERVTEDEEEDEKGEEERIEASYEEEHEEERIEASDEKEDDEEREEKMYSNSSDEKEDEEQRGEKIEASDEKEDEEERGDKIESNDEKEDEAGGGENIETNDKKEDEEGGEKIETDDKKEDAVLGEDENENPNAQNSEKEINEEGPPENVGAE